MGSTTFDQAYDAYMAEVVKTLETNRPNVKKFIELSPLQAANDTISAKIDMSGAVYEIRIRSVTDSVTTKSSSKNVIHGEDPDQIPLFPDPSTISPPPAHPASNGFEAAIAGAVVHRKAPPVGGGRPPAGPKRKGRKVTAPRVTATPAGKGA